MKLIILKINIKYSLKNIKVFILTKKMKYLNYAIQIVELVIMEEMEMKIIVHHVKLIIFLNLMYMTQQIVS